MTIERLREATARAIWDAVEDDAWEDGGRNRQGQALKCADAAILAVLDGIREPDDGLTRIGMMAVMRDGEPDFPGDNSCQTVYAAVSAAEAGEIYRAMLDSLRARIGRVG